MEIQFTNGGRVLSLSTNLATTRSYTAQHLYLDEFVYIPNNEDIYKAIAPATTRGGNITLISTPGPEAGMFYDIYTKKDKYKQWNIHTIDIYKAKEGGFPVNIPELKLKISEPARFANEYECKFYSSAYSFISLSLLQSNILKGKLKAQEYYIGMDIGRTKDTTEIIVIGKTDKGLFFYVEGLTLANTKFSIQKKAVVSFIEKYKPNKVNIDSTGLGIQLSEELEDMYPGICHGVTFTNKIKDVMANKVKNNLSDNNLLLPEDKDLQSHITSISRQFSNSGNFIYKVNSTQHHADKFWALALGILVTNEQEAESVYNNLIGV